MIFSREYYLREQYHFQICSEIQPHFIAELQNNVLIKFVFQKTVRFPFLWDILSPVSCLISQVKLYSLLLKILGILYSLFFHLIRKTWHLARLYGCI